MHTSPMTQQWKGELFGGITAETAFKNLRKRDKSCLYTIIISFAICFFSTPLSNDVDIYNRECGTSRTLLTYLVSQSKLSQEELNQLQKDTHFDKKELQQWYKGQLL